jgi:hypothetical protein
MICGNWWSPHSPPLIGKVGGPGNKQESVPTLFLLPLAGSAAMDHKVAAVGVSRYAPCDGRREIRDTPLF